MDSMNKGYVGWSMSERAAIAYDTGEMPKSKWTKAAMVAALKEHCRVNGLLYDASVESLRKDEMFSQLFELSSWHHVSKFCNAADFYSVSDSAASEAFRPMTDEEIEAEDAKRLAAIAAAVSERAAEDERMRARLEKEAAYKDEHGFAPDTLAAYMLAHPERCTRRVGKKGTALVDVTDGSGRLMSFPERDAASRRIRFFNAVRM